MITVVKGYGIPWKTESVEIKCDRCKSVMHIEDMKTGKDKQKQIEIAIEKILEKQEAIGNCLTCLHCGLEMKVKGGVK